jgi:hypothetical protein
MFVCSYTKSSTCCKLGYMWSKDCCLNLY